MGMWGDGRMARGIEDRFRYAGEWVRSEHPRWVRGLLLAEIVAGCVGVWVTRGVVMGVVGLAGWGLPMLAATFVPGRWVGRISRPVRGVVLKSWWPGFVGLAMSAVFSRQAGDGIVVVSAVGLTAGSLLGFGGVFPWRVGGRKRREIGAAAED